MDLIDGWVWLWNVLGVPDSLLWSVLLRRESLNTPSHCSLPSLLPIPFSSGCHTTWHLAVSFSSCLLLLLLTGSELAPASTLVVFPHMILPSTHIHSTLASFFCVPPSSGMLLRPTISLYHCLVCLWLHRHKTAIEDAYVGKQNADLLATLYDVGGIIGKGHSFCVGILNQLWTCVCIHTCMCLSTQTPGGITTGLISDLLSARAISCILMMYLAVPTVSLQVHVHVCSVSEFLTFCCLLFDIAVHLSIHWAWFAGVGNWSAVTSLCFERSYLQ